MTVEERYRQVVAAVDAEFDRNRELHGERIHCKPGCTDCCHHVFPISELEAANVRRGLEQLDPGLREAIEVRAQKYVDEYLVRGTRQPCPALEAGVCSIYEFRPLMCRKFGMPLYNPEKPDRIFACALNFGDGEEIHDPKLIQIQTRIDREWKKVQAEYACSHEPQHTGRMTVAHAVLLARVNPEA